MQESIRLTEYADDNDVLRAIELDQIEERRDRAALRMTAYQRRMSQAYSKNVHPFENGDLVWRMVQYHGERANMKTLSRCLKILRLDQPEEILLMPPPLRMSPHDQVRAPELNYPHFSPFRCDDGAC
ncbi:hypothetical protein F511_26952 [Dorcoceras hygrometricum]|uniref:Uncharacterized protein n=1 Tax=Dorcoceras hygrometricum TaxID=472368 RepID=A0A2Z7AI07_9LAMI|nr:hypothetical protein F511_26952 [Dorcoceras hygrometricum]